MWRSGIRSANGTVKRCSSTGSIANYSVWHQDKDHAAPSVHHAAQEQHSHGPHHSSHQSEHSTHAATQATRKHGTGQTEINNSSPFTDAAVAEYSEMKPTRLTLKTLLHFGKQIDDVKVCHNETV